MRYLQTVNEIKGYQYSNGSSGKRWIRGRKMISGGKKWVSQNECIAILTVTDLDTGEITEADSKIYKKFLTPECYKEWLLEQSIKNNK